MTDHPGDKGASAITVVSNPADSLAAERPVRWAVGQLQKSLQQAGLPCAEKPSLADVPATGIAIVVAGQETAMPAEMMAAVGWDRLATPESFLLLQSASPPPAKIAVVAADVRGLVYGLLELADRVSLANDPLAVLLATDSELHRPANRIRSIARLFTSDVEDKAWYYDKSFWKGYLSMLSAQRFNRFNLTLGLAYSGRRRIRDSYFYFAYPFLLAIDGYDVHAEGLPDEERDRNLEMLRWISDEAARRGLHFQLGLWAHAYELIDSPDVNYPITGLTPDSHAPYCAAALETLLRACPAISGVTFRAHSESGIPENSHEFWQSVFEGMKRTGRSVEIDIHAKGIEHELLDIAVRTGLPVNVSPKYSGEHMGLPYHQAAIRELERRPREPGSKRERLRRFTRYGYGDYLRRDRQYGVLHRVWPGTQRLLLWGDPVLASGFGRFAHFCGSDGLELCEPLSFKGRMGTGIAGGRNGYADVSLRPADGDWRKHEYTYRLWGRLLYDPDSDGDSWRRYLRNVFGPAAGCCEEALAWASRVLPLVTMARAPSASSNRYWPEMYTNMPIAKTDLGHPYRDTPEPREFATVSPMDPAMFVGIEEFAEEILTGCSSGRHSPLDVARRLNEMARRAADALTEARNRVTDAGIPEFRRLDIDVAIQAGLGRFFAFKLLAGLAYVLGKKTSDPGCMSLAVRHYQTARDAWAELANRADGVYVRDVTFGKGEQRRGHWLDRLPAIDQDLAEVKRQATQTQRDAAAPTCPSDVRAALEAGPSGEYLPLPAHRPNCLHQPPVCFTPGDPLPITLAVEPGYELAGARLYCRPANQADVYDALDMKADGDRWTAIIPAECTDSPYPLLYYFQCHRASGESWLWPGLGPDLSNQPYFALSPAGVAGNTRRTK